MRHNASMGMMLALLAGSNVLGGRRIDMLPEPELPDFNFKEFNRHVRRDLQRKNKSPKLLKKEAKEKAARKQSRMTRRKRKKK